MRNFLQKPVFEKGNADWKSELPSVLKKYNITIHHSIKTTPVEASKKLNEKILFDNLKQIRENQSPKFKLAQLVRVADIKKVFSMTDSTNSSYQFYTITEVLYDTISSYKLKYKPERYNQNLLLLTKLTLEENNPKMKKRNFIEEYNK